jgi:hypothetical protein
MKSSLAILLGILLAATPSAAVRAQMAPLPSGAVVLPNSLSFEQSGSDVSLLQQFLKEKGYFTFPLITGYFGTYTEDAVIDFQRAYGIDPVGIAGPVTRLKILELTGFGTSTIATTTATTTSGEPKQVHHHGSSHTVVSPPAPAADTAFPTISITAPVDGAIASGTAVALTATATDDVGVAGVQFKLDRSDIGSEATSAPYEISWDSTTVADGAHTITAVARDTAGNSTTSDVITITVDNTAPAGFITAPPLSVTYSPGQPITLSANASDNVAVASVKFEVKDSFFPNTLHFSSTATSSPYTASWPNPADGTYILTVMITDTAGNVTIYMSTFTATVELGLS